MGARRCGWNHSDLVRFVARLVAMNLRVIPQAPQRWPPRQARARAAGQQRYDPTICYRAGSRTPILPSWRYYPRTEDRIELPPSKQPNQQENDSALIRDEKIPSSGRWRRARGCFRFRADFFPRPLVAKGSVECDKRITGPFDQGTQLTEHPKIPSAACWVPPRYSFRQALMQARAWSLQAPLV
jgi:hypothetical protein